MDEKKATGNSSTMISSTYICSYLITYCDKLMTQVKSDDTIYDSFLALKQKENYSGRSRWLFTNKTIIQYLAK